MVTKNCQVCTMYWHLHFFSNAFAYMPGFEPDSWTIKILSSSPSKFNISLLWIFPPWLCIWKHVNFTTSKKKKTWIHEILNHIPNVLFCFRKIVVRCHPNSSFFYGLVWASSFQKLPWSIPLPLCLVLHIDPNPGGSQLTGTFDQWNSKEKNSGWLRPGNLT